AALDRWGAPRVGICVGSSTAAMDEIEGAFRANALTGQLPEGFDVLAKGSADGLVRAVQSLTGIQGPSAVLSNACASSGKAFASAKRWLEADLVDAVLVGGADSLCQLTLRGFRALGLLAPGPSRPFGLNREGIHIGEGAAFCLMERSGSGPRFLGAGETADAHHMTTPDPLGKGASAAMHQALERAGLQPEDIDYINAHGTGTPLNDDMEAKAIRGVLGNTQKDPIVASTKGFVGHTLGAAGAIEAVFALASLVHQFTPASLGADPIDPSLPIQIATESTATSVDFVLSNSFAFGGSNVSLVFGAPQ
ncbi:beta-ketoacyl-[acyl-carrier-protein] synthase II, partial [Myxococcota bacterium]|nr:beta-ketoacyl-[acyl-carrier-protein] synthase II [Myxococcota bacterium]